MLQPKTYLDRKFKTILGDAIFLVEQCAKAKGEEWSPPESRFARAAIATACLLLEAAANCGLASLRVGGQYAEDLDRLPILGKFEYFLRMSKAGEPLDRGAAPVQQADELIKKRNSIVHPREFKAQFVKSGERKYSVDLGNTPLLHLPNSLAFARYEHALSALRAAMRFLSFFYREKCNLKDYEVRNILLTEAEYRFSTKSLLSGIISATHDPDWIRLHDEWGLDVSFLVDVAMVKAGEARFREHLAHVDGRKSNA